MFGCKCRKAHVWQLGTSGKLKAKTGFFFPPPQRCDQMRNTGALLFFVAQLTDNVGGGESGFVFNCEIHEGLCSL